MSSVLASDLVPAASKDQISVKNTFIQFTESAVGEADAVQLKRGRSSSLPPAFRTDKPFALPSGGAMTPPADCSSHISFTSGASTESGEVESQSGSVHSEGSLDATTPSGSSASPHMGTDTVTCPVILGTAPSAMEGASPDPMAGQAFFMMPVAMVPMPVCTGEKAKLSSGAKCFVPSIPKAAEVHPVFSPQTEKMVETVRGAMTQAGVSLVVGDVESSLGPQGWTVNAQIVPEGWAWRERLLSVAKEALLRAAEQSESVYVHGYASKPFKPTPLGFAATLMGIEDESKACWWHVAKMSCHKGAKCQWSHSDFMIQVWVNITA